jgi:RNA polymerase sigma-70 factor (ECF subfamily)
LSEGITQPAAFRDAYTELRPVALRVALSVLGGDEDAAEDVVQDVFMHLWRRPAAYDPARGSLRTYVAMLTRSRAVDRWRASGTYRSALRRAASELRVLPEATESAMERVIRRDGERRAVAALDGLPGEQRDAVLLAAVGLTAAEIAGIAGMPLGTAKSRVRLGLEKARAHLDDAA